MGYGMFDLIRWAMAGFSIGGAFLTPLIPAKYRLGGFALWVVSNAYWLFIFVTAKDYPLAAMYAVFECANILGVINNYREMRRKSDET
jgi:hypothetical protein